MTVSREDILREVRRLAEANGGKPLGRLAFFNQSGIRESDWSGRFWARWNDVLKDAGFGPNSLNKAREDAVLLNRFADFALELGRLPVNTELRLKKRTDPSFPNNQSYTRFGNKSQFLTRLLSHCELLDKYASLLPLISAKLKSSAGSDESPTKASGSTEGFVYMVKMGKHYKIGKTFAVPRRHRELALELPEKLKPVHVIRTDDPTGIEAYWHKRFVDKCTNSEWFALSPQDVSVFKKRRFM